MRHTVAQGKLKQILVSFPFLSLSLPLPLFLLLCWIFAFWPPRCNLKNFWPQKNISKRSKLLWVEKKEAAKHIRATQSKRTRSLSADCEGYQHRDMRLVMPWDHIINKISIYNIDINSLCRVHIKINFSNLTISNRKTQEFERFDEQIS